MRELSISLILVCGACGCVRSVPPAESAAEAELRQHTVHFPPTFHQSEVIAVESGDR